MEIHYVRKQVKRREPGHERTHDTAIYHYYLSWFTYYIPDAERRSNFYYRPVLSAEMRTEAYYGYAREKRTNNRSLVYLKRAAAEQRLTMSLRLPVFVCFCLHGCTV